MIRCDQHTREGQKLEPRQDAKKTKLIKPRQKRQCMAMSRHAEKDRMSRLIVQAEAKTRTGSFLIFADCQHQLTLIRTSDCWDSFAGDPIRQMLCLKRVWSIENIFSTSTSGDTNGPMTQRWLGRLSYEPIRHLSVCATKRESAECLIRNYFWQLSSHACSAKPLDAISSLCAGT